VRVIETSYLIGMRGVLLSLTGLPFSGNHAEVATLGSTFRIDTITERGAGVAF
jgi:hypothetical protein